jgi:hypothetical protein
MSSLEEVWAYREETLYPQLFGEKHNGIFVLDHDDFTSLGAENVDPRWLHLGVFEFEPTPARNSWLYVTSGGSTPWETEPADYNPEEYSWLGSELVIEVPSQPQDQWPIKLLRRLLAYNVLLAHGQFGEDKPLLYPATAQLASGQFDFLHAVGITDSEKDWARAHSSEALLRLLEVHGGFPVTDPRRKAVA